MAERRVHPVLKTTLELGPVLGFFVVFHLLKDETYTIAGTGYSGLVLVTALFIPVFLAAMAVLWALTGRLSRMQVFTAGMLIVFGGLTIWLNDDRFIKMKQTIVFGLFGAVLGLGLLMGRSFLQYVMEELLPMTQDGWMILTRRFTALFLGLAALNEAIWRFLSDDIWIAFDTFGVPAAIFGFFLLQARLFETHQIEDKGDAGA